MHKRQRKECGQPFDREGYRVVMAPFFADTVDGGAFFMRALDFAVQAHEGQSRKSGEPYICHPCAVARILAMELDIRDQELLAAALLHDTVEDVEHVTIAGIRELFGTRVAALVDGCTKIATTGDDTKQAFNRKFQRKIFNAVADNLEVILIKLADRLHNMRTLKSMKKDRRQKVATETLNIYAPIAKLLGLFDLKRELNALAITYQFEKASKKIVEEISRLQEAFAPDTVVASLRESLAAAGVDAELNHRMRGLGAYYDEEKRVLRPAIGCPLEITVCVSGPLIHCYFALGVINQAYPPIPKSIRDFIANPKLSGYRCLHSRANIGGVTCMFKIRSEEMLLGNRRGIIRSWSQEGVRRDFMRHLRELFQTLGQDDGMAPGDLLAASSTTEIHTFSPKGKVVRLPEGAIVLDFAFGIHTSLGYACAGAVIGGRRVGPEEQLQDGDTVHIVRREASEVHGQELMRLCKTARARHEISKTLRERLRGFEVVLGRFILQQEFRWQGVEFAVLDSEMAKLLMREETRILAAVKDGIKGEALVAPEEVEAFFALVGAGLVNLPGFIDRVKKELCRGRDTLAPPTGLYHSYVLNFFDPVCMKFAACCNPVPTAKTLLGLLTERGVSVHRSDCQQARHTTFLRHQALSLHWQQEATRVLKEQAIVLMRLPAARLWHRLGRIPVEARVQNIVCLSPTETLEPHWEIEFTVPNLRILGAFLKCFEGVDASFSLEY